VVICSTILYRTISSLFPSKSVYSKRTIVHKPKAQTVPIGSIVKKSDHNSSSVNKPTLGNISAPCLFVVIYLSVLDTFIPTLRSLMFRLLGVS